MRPGLFEQGEFDTVCLFQVFDHLPEPGAFLDDVRAVMSQGGVLLCFNHNVGAASSRMLGEKSPIVDIEHCYLYSPVTMKVILEKHGFDVVDVGAATNTLSVRHLLHLLPAPKALTQALLAAADRPGPGRLGLRFPLRNRHTVRLRREP